MKIGIIHNYIRIAGSDRLIIDTAALLSKSNNVTLVIANICSNKLLDNLHKNIQIVNLKYFTTHLLSFSWVLTELLLSIYFSIQFLYHQFKFDIIFMDTEFFLIPFLKLLNYKTIFYCHFPKYIDFTKKRSFMRKIHNLISYYVYQFCLFFCDKVLVNSEYTRKMFIQMNPLNRIKPEVLYPCTIINKNIKLQKNHESIKYPILQNDKKYNFILTINRFEPEKNFELSIDTYYLCRFDNKNLKLIIAGSCKDTKNKYLEKLKNHAKHKGLSISFFPIIHGDVIFYLNFPNSMKSKLFKISKCVLYTPLIEHFGIVPIEAMALKVPIIAVNAGGPLESIINNTTGMLVEPTAIKFSKAVNKILKNIEFANGLKEKGYNHVTLKFSEDKYYSKLKDLLKEVKRDKNNKRMLLCMSLLCVGVFVFVFIYSFCKYFGNY